MTIEKLEQLKKERRLCRNRCHEIENIMYTNTNLSLKELQSLYKEKSDLEKRREEISNIIVEYKFSTGIYKKTIY